MADSVHTTGIPKIDRRDVMRMAWETYCKQVGESEMRFSRRLFGAHLRSAWSVCRIVAYRARVDAQETAQRASSDPVVRRTAELRAEIRGLETSDFIDWSRHRDLSAELFRIGQRDSGCTRKIPDPDSSLFDGGAEAELEEVA